MEKKKYRVDPLPTGDPYNERYCVVDADTGEILDDAQGYGYKTKQRAHAAWAYKSKSEEEKEAAYQRDKAIWDWLQEHKEISDALDDYAIASIKNPEPFGVKAVKEILEELGVEAPYMAKEILRVWGKGRPPRKNKK